jgi:hypothetical protein
MTVVHDFNESLRRSHSYADAPWWRQVYEKAFPGMEYMQDLRADGWWQRAGIDRRIFLSNKAIVTVDEKVRKDDWPDFLLEAWSKWHENEELRKPGWIEYAACDYIAYAFIPSRRCYLLPMRELHRVWLERWPEWLQQYGYRDAPNRGYVTRSVPVPIPVVLDAIRDCSLITWSLDVHQEVR